LTAGARPRKFEAMRNLRLVAFLAPALLLAAACEDSSSSSGGTFTPEGGAEFEAGLPSEAGPPPDAGADADAAVAPKGVTVMVVAGLAPKPDARVLAHDATGAVVADLKTDATGKVTLATAPSMVTVLTQYGLGSSASFEPLTYVGVVDGDNLVVDATDPYVDTSTAAGSYTVSFAAPFAGATDYDVRIGASCGGATSTPANPLTVAVTSTCVGAQNAIFATASNAGSPLAYGFVKGAAKPAVGGALAVGPITFVAKGTTTVKATNLAAGDSGYGNLFAIANGTSFYTSSIGGTLEGAGLDFSTATGFADAYQSTVTAQHYDNGGTQARTFVRRETTVAPATESLAAFDFATALPAVTNVTYANATVERPEVTVTSAAPMAAADGAVAVIGWYISNGEQSQNGRWTILLPPSTSTFKVPALPPGLDPGFVPNANSYVYEVSFVEASQVPGYKELKSLPASPAGWSLLDASRPLPAAGTLRVSAWNAGD
jgi:hypothetical protein